MSAGYRSEAAIRALELECRAMTTFLLDLAEEDFARLTNCPPWTLKELVVHTRFSINVPHPMPSPAVGARLCEAADYYRRDERRTDEYRTRNVRIAQELAAQQPTGRAAAEDLVLAAERLVSRLEGEDLGALVAYGETAALTFGDFVLTRLLAVAAHGIDMAIAMRHAPWTQRETAQLLAPMLLSLLGQPLPPTLGWDDQHVLESGTGRRPLTERERAQLGRLADAFPLIS